MICLLLVYVSLSCSFPSLFWHIYWDAILIGPKDIKVTVQGDDECSCVSLRAHASRWYKRELTCSLPPCFTPALLIIQHNRTPDTVPNLRAKVAGGVGTLTNSILLSCVSMFKKKGANDAEWLISMINSRVSPKKDTGEDKNTTIKKDKKGW